MKHRDFKSALILCVFALGCGAPANKASGGRSAEPVTLQPAVVAIQPYQGVSATVVREVTKALKGIYGCEVRVLPTQPLPKSAYYPPRRRYRADRILQVLDGSGTITLGVTTKDISATMRQHRDWGLFGLGYMPGKASVISSYRLGRSLERIRRIAIHEVGHNFGLAHCPTPRCVMNDAKGSVKTVDNSTGTLCRTCRSFLARKR